MTLTIDIVTLFPDFFKSPMDESLLEKAQVKGLVKIRAHDLREWTNDRHKTADDKPFGGGAGMVMKPEPIFEAVESLAREGTRVILLSPAGRTLNQAIAQELAGLDHLLLVSGHYEGFDERIRSLADEEVSTGDFVLTGGELPAATIINGVVRLLPGTLGCSGSLEEESHSSPLLEHPHYTRPANFRDMEVPELLRSGDHGAIARWRIEQQRLRTRQRRADLYARLQRGPVRDWTASA
jgi:tRNA (guanine37-N1)-methyltransferase